MEALLGTREPFQSLAWLPKTFHLLPAPLAAAPQQIDDGKGGFDCSLPPSGQGQVDCDSQKDVSPTSARGVSTTAAPPLQLMRRKEVSRQGDRPRRGVHPSNSGTGSNGQPHQAVQPPSIFKQPTALKYHSSIHTCHLRGE